MPKHIVEIAFRTAEAATKFRRLLRDLRDGKCGLRSIAVCIRDILRKSQS